MRRPEGGLVVDGPGDLPPRGGGRRLGQVDPGHSGRPRPAGGPGWRPGGERHPLRLDIDLEDGEELLQLDEDGRGGGGGAGGQEATEAVERGAGGEGEEDGGGRCI